MKKTGIQQMEQFPTEKHVQAGPFEHLNASNNKTKNMAKKILLLFYLSI